jgi:hypothetical protein
MNVRKFVILWKGLFAMMEYFQLIEIYGLSIEEQKLKQKEFF